jgi:hypothetical protein
MAKLTVAVDESKEAIGKGLLDALAALSGSNSIDTFTTKMVNAAEKIGGAFRTIGDVIGLLNPNASIKVGGKFVRRSDVMNQNQGGYSGIPGPRKAEVKAIKDSVALRKAENDLLKKKTAVDQLRDKFDVERIGLTAALNAATDEETKLRLRSQLAILDNNEALAKKLLAEMNGVKATEELTKALYSVAGAAMDSALKFRQINPFAGTMYGETGRTMSSTPSLSNLPGGLPPAVTNPLAGTYYGETGRDLPSNLRITVDTASTGDRFSQLIAESLQIAGRSGYSSVPNGSLPV